MKVARIFDLDAGNSFTRQTFPLQGGGGVLREKSSTSELGTALPDCCIYDVTSLLYLLLTTFYPTFNLPFIRCTYLSHPIPSQCPTQK
jgi:hypothetical protein